VTRQFPLRIVIVYAAFSALWMAGSDWLVEHVPPDFLAPLLAGRGWVFAGFTVVFLYVLLQGEAKRRHAIESRLTEIENCLDATFEKAAVGIAHADLNGRFLRVNAELCRMIGYTAAEMLGLCVHDITHPDDLPECLSSMNELLAGRVDAYPGRSVYIRKDGAIVWDGPMSPWREPRRAIPTISSPPSMRSPSASRRKRDSNANASLFIPSSTRFRTACWSATPPARSRCSTGPSANSMASMRPIPASPPARNRWRGTRPSMTSCRQQPGKIYRSFGRSREKGCRTSR